MYVKEYVLIGGIKEVMEKGALSVIRKGLPLEMLDMAANLLQLSKAELIPLIGASIRSIQRQKSAKNLTPQQSERLLAIVGVLTNAEDYFGSQEEALAWLKTSQIAFGNKSALECLDTIMGINLVNDEINRMRYGMTA